MKVIQIADIHIPNSTKDGYNRPYMNMIDNAVKSIYNEVKNDDPNDVRIVICGDIFQNKIKTSNEAKQMFHQFLNYIDEMGIQTIIYAGNHDLLEKNNDRLDSITPTFEISNAYPNITYADYILNYKSGTIVDDEAKIIWALYSILDNFKKPEINLIKEEHPDYTVIGLYHGDVIGATTDTGRVSENGVPFTDFEGCDCVMMGHIHKHQEIKKEGIKFVYAGSLFQKDAGENLTGHGFLVWDLTNLKYKLIEVENDYRLFRLSLSSYDDVNDDKEILINL